MEDVEDVDDDVVEELTPKKKGKKSSGKVIL